MASIRDVPRAIRAIGVVELGKRVYREMGQDNAWTMASAMAYSWLFAIFPFFIFLLALIPYIGFAQAEQADEVIGQFVTQFPPDAAATLLSNIESLRQNPKGGFLSLGIILALWAASGGMAATMSAISRCYDMNPRPIYKHRPLAMGMTVIVAALIIAVIVLLPVASALRAWVMANPERLAYIGGMWPLVLLDLARYAIALLLLFSALAVVYHFGPNIRQTFHLITPGSVFVVVSWLVLGAGFKWYVVNFANYDAMYGAVGGVIILLFIFYLDSLVLLVGAEINSEIDFALRPHLKEDDFREGTEIVAEAEEAEPQVNADRSEG